MQVKESERLYIVKYPPDYDRELHIAVDEKVEGGVGNLRVTFGVRFEIAAISSKETVREMLARVGADLVRQFG